MIACTDQCVVFCCLFFLLFFFQIFVCFSNFVVLVSCCVDLCVPRLSYVLRPSARALTN